MSIFVGNLPFRAEREDVLQLFTPYGEVTNCSLPLERDTGRKRGFAFIEMADESLETSAIEALQGSELMGRPLRINKAEPRNNSPRRNNFNGNPRSSNNSGYSNSNNYGSGGSSGYGNSYGSNQNSGNSYSNTYSSDNNSGSGFNAQNTNPVNRTSGAQGWEDRSYGNTAENSEYENGRSRRRRGTANDSDINQDD